MAFDNLRLEKGMYRQSGKTFTQVLEELDPSENYRGTSLEKSDAFQRQFRRPAWSAAPSPQGRPAWAG